MFELSRTSLRIQITLLGSALLFGAPALAHEPVAAPPTSGTAVPLYDNLGDLHYPVDTRHELAQRYFDQGLRLTYAFNHGEALRAFRAAQQHDPQCAMCYWGEAFVLGPNINAPMDADAANPAVAAINKARDLAHDAKEKGWIEALAKRYSDDPDADRGPLNEAYAAAMGELAGQYPADQEIAVFFVDALMNTSPWDYWEADGVTSKGRIGEAIAMAEQVLQRNPNHPGAIHLYIHLTEASNDPHRAEPYAERLAGLMPGAGHLVHMPSHTFFRVGRYEDSENVNKRAVKADEDYLDQVGYDGLYAFGYYPHNIHYVLTSAQMAGDAATAFEYAERLQGKIPDVIAASVGWTQAILTAPYYAHAQLSTPATILALPDPGTQFPFVQAMWHYARGVAYAAQGEMENAQTESARIAELNNSSDFGMLLDWAVPAPDLLRIAQHVLAGRIAQAQNDAQRAVKEFEIAAAIQDTIAYMEPPYWYYPVSQSLGAALLQAGEPQRAVAAFERSLEQFPENGWSLYGLMQALQACDDAVAAQDVEQRFKQAWAGGELDLRKL